MSSSTTDTSPIPLTFIPRDEQYQHYYLQPYHSYFGIQQNQLPASSTNHHHSHQFKRTVQKAWKSSKSQLSHFYRRALSSLLPTTFIHHTPHCPSPHLTVESHLNSLTDSTPPRRSSAATFSPIVLQDNKDLLPVSTSVNSSSGVRNSEESSPVTSHQASCSQDPDPSLNQFSSLTSINLHPTDQTTHQDSSSTSPFHYLCTSPFYSKGHYSFLHKTDCPSKSVSSPFSSRLFPSTFLPFHFLLHQPFNKRSLHRYQTTHQTLNIRLLSFSPLLTTSTRLFAPMDVSLDSSILNAISAVTTPESNPALSVIQSHQNGLHSARSDDQQIINFKESTSLDSTPRTDPLSVTCRQTGSIETPENCVDSAASSQPLPTASLVEKWLKDSSGHKKPSNGHSKQSRGCKDSIEKGTATRSKRRGLNSSNSNRSLSDLADSSVQQERDTSNNWGKQGNSSPIASTSLHSSTSVSQKDVSEQKSLIYTNRADSNGRTPPLSNACSGQLQNGPRRAYDRVHRKRRATKRSQLPDSDTRRARQPSTSHSAFSSHSGHSSRKTSQHLHRASDKNSGLLPASSQLNTNTIIMTCIVLLGISPGLVIIVVPLLLLIPFILVGSIPAIAAIPVFLIIKHLRQRYKYHDRSIQPVNHPISLLYHSKESHAHQPCPSLHDISHNGTHNEAEVLSRNSSSRRSRPLRSQSSLKSEVIESNFSERVMKRVRDTSNVSRYYLTSCDEEEHESGHIETHGVSSQRKNSWMLNDNNGITSQHAPEQSLLQSQAPRLVSGDDSTVASVALYDEFIDPSNHSHRNDDGRYQIVSSNITLEYKTPSESATRQIGTVPLIDNQEFHNILMDFDIDMDPFLALLAVILIPILSLCCIPIFFCLPFLLILLIPLLLVMPFIILLLLPLIAGIAFFCSFLLAFFLPWRFMWQTLKDCVKSTLKMIDASLQSIFKPSHPILSTIDP